MGRQLWTSVIGMVLAGCIGGPGDSKEGDAEENYAAECHQFLGEVCQGTCVDLRSDRNNCGECGNRCGTFDMCVDGECVCDDSSCYGCETDCFMDTCLTSCNSCGASGLCEIESYGNW